ncbi:MAG: ABC transporter substrate-binding protein [Waddliaceae bacterium]|nr:ABC transporter substrate-binding protein [Waddliaceae bacterium]
MRKKILFLFFYVSLAITFLSSCSRGNHENKLGKWLDNNGKLKVLCTVAMLTDVVKQVGGDYVDVITLIDGELDPHSYELVKGDDDKLNFAQIIFYNGLNLEHGPSLKSYLEASSNSVAVGDWIINQSPGLLLYTSGQKDPHIWMDVSIWRRGISPIVEALAQAMPEHAEIFQKNGDVLGEEMDRIHMSLQKELKAVPAHKRYLVTSHDAFNYFTRAYLSEKDEWKDEAWRIRCNAPEGLAPESQLSVSDIQRIINHLIKYDLHVIFSESNVSKDSIRKIVNAGAEKGLNVTIPKVVLYADAMGAKGSDGDTYLKMIQHNARVIADYLNK